MGERDADVVRIHVADLQQLIQERDQLRRALHTMQENSNARLALRRVRDKMDAMFEEAETVAREVERGDPLHPAVAAHRAFARGMHVVIAAVRTYLPKEEK